MVSSLISAVSYADIAFFVILGLGLLAGIIGGLARCFKGFFKTVAVILISILLVGATIAPVCKIGFIESLSDKLEATSSGWGVLFTAPIHIEEDGSFYINVEAEDGTMTKVALADASGSGLVDSTKGKLANWLAERFITEDGQTLGAASASMLTSVIVSIVLFIIYCILLGIICWVLRKIFKSIHQSDSVAIKTVDRVLGAIVSAGLAFIFVLLVLAILHALSNVIPSVHEYLLTSKVCGYFYEHNPIGLVFSRIFG